WPKGNTGLLNKRSLRRVLSRLWPRQTGHDAGADRVGHGHEDNRDRAGLRLQRKSAIHIEQAKGFKRRNRQQPNLNGFRGRRLQTEFHGSVSGTVVPRLVLRRLDLQSSQTLWSVGKGSGAPFRPERNSSAYLACMGAKTGGGRNAPIQRR